jgi:hypothetical protein
VLIHVGCATSGHARRSAAVSLNAGMMFLE